MRNCRKTNYVLKNPDVAKAGTLPIYNFSRQLELLSTPGLVLGRLYDEGY
jgi:hypothetical protein